jgi:hypothetical protein
MVIVPVGAGVGVSVRVGVVVGVALAVGGAEVADGVSTAVGFSGAGFAPHPLSSAAMMRTERKAFLICKDENPTFTVVDYHDCEYLLIAWFHHPVKRYISRHVFSEGNFFLLILLFSW